MDLVILHVEHAPKFSKKIEDISDKTVHPDTTIDINNLIQEWDPSFSLFHTKGLEQIYVLLDDPV